MSYTVAITKTGQMTLPKALREFLGVDGDKRITLNRRKDGVVIERKMTKDEYYHKVDNNINANTRRILEQEADSGRPPVRDMMREIANSAETQAGWKAKYGQ